MFLGVDSLIPRLHQMEPGNEVKVSSFQRLHQYELEFSSVVLSPPPFSLFGLCSQYMQVFNGEDMGSFITWKGPKFKKYT